MVRREPPRSQAQLGMKIHTRWTTSPASRQWSFVDRWLSHVKLAPFILSAIPASTSGNPPRASLLGIRFSSPEAACVYSEWRMLRLETTSPLQLQLHHSSQHVGTEAVQMHNVSTCEEPFYILLRLVMAARVRRMGCSQALALRLRLRDIRAA